WNGPWTRPLFPALFQDWIGQGKVDQAHWGKWKSQGVFFQGPQLLCGPIFQGGRPAHKPVEGEQGRQDPDGTATGGSFQTVGPRVDRPRGFYLQGQGWGGRYLGNHRPPGQF